MIVVGTRKAMAMAVKRTQSRGRITTLRERLIQHAGVPTRLALDYADFDSTGDTGEDYSLAAEAPEDYGASTSGEFDPV